MATCENEAAVIPQASSGDERMREIFYPTAMPVSLSFEKVPDLFSRDTPLMFNLEIASSRAELYPPAITPTTRGATLCDH